MSRQALVVRNPRAGDGLASDALSGLLGAHPEVEVVVSDQRSQLDHSVAKAIDEGCETIIAAGGDGTISATVNAMGERRNRARLGILPMGTANDFAKTLGIPGLLEDALSVALGRHDRRIDLIKVESTATQLVINAISGGLPVTAQESLDPDLKRRWRGLAYLRAAIAALPNAPIYRCTIELDGHRENVETAGMLIANGQYAGGMRLVPSAEPDDKRLDVAMVLAEGFAQRAKLLAEFAVGRHLENQDLLYRRVRTVHLESEPTMRFHSDGDAVGSTPATFRLLPAALRVACPPPETTADA